MYNQRFCPWKIGNKNLPRENPPRLKASKDFFQSLRKRHGKSPAQPGSNLGQQNDPRFGGNKMEGGGVVYGCFPGKPPSNPVECWSLEYLWKVVTCGAAKWCLWQAKWSAVIMIEVWVYRSYLRNYWLTLWVGDVGPRWIVNSYSFPTLKRWAFWRETPSHMPYTTHPNPSHILFASIDYSSNNHCSFSKSCLVVRPFKKLFSTPFSKTTSFLDVLSRRRHSMVPISWSRLIKTWSRRIIPMWWILEGESFFEPFPCLGMQCLGLVHSNVTYAYLNIYSDSPMTINDLRMTTLHFWKLCVSSRTFSLKLSRSTLPQVSVCIDTKQRLQTSCYLVTKDMVALCEMAILKIIVQKHSWSFEVLKSKRSSPNDKVLNHQLWLLPK